MNDFLVVDAKPMAKVCAKALRDDERHCGNVGAVVEGVFGCVWAPCLNLLKRPLLYKEACSRTSQTASRVPFLFNLLDFAHRSSSRLVIV